MGRRIPQHLRHVVVLSFGNDRAVFPLFENSSYQAHVCLGGHLSTSRDNTVWSLRPYHQPGAVLLLPVLVASGRTSQEQTNRVTTAHPRLGSLARESVVEDGVIPSVCRAVVVLGVEVLERYLAVARRRRYWLRWYYVVVYGGGSNQNRQLLVKLLRHDLDAVET
uniref:Uncharacterized protein n=1 Tax=Peronospora matthiolae TaxID=2874970 RepID=A0AAV1VAC7_9STRA